MVPFIRIRTCGRSVGIYWMSTSPISRIWYPGGRGYALVGLAKNKRKTKSEEMKTERSNEKFLQMRY
jgi:hypothetical protein